MNGQHIFKLQQVSFKFTQNLKKNWIKLAPSSWSILSIDLNNVKNSFLAIENITFQETSPLKKKPVAQWRSCYISIQLRRSTHDLPRHRFPSSQTFLKQNNQIDFTMAKSPKLKDSQYCYQLVQLTGQDKSLLCFMICEISSTEAILIFCVRSYFLDGIWQQAGLSWIQNCGL